MLIYVMKELDIWEILCQAPRILPDCVYKAYETEVITPCIVPPAEENLPEVKIHRCSISTVPARKKKDEDSKI